MAFDFGIARYFNKIFTGTAQRKERALSAFLLISGHYFSPSGKKPVLSIATRIGAEVITVCVCTTCVPPLGRRFYFAFFKRSFLFED